MKREVIYLFLLSLFFLPYVYGLTVAPARYDLGEVVAGERYPIIFSISDPEDAIISIAGDCSATPDRVLADTQRVWIPIPDFQTGNSSCHVDFSSQSIVGITLSIPITYTITQEAEHALDITILHGTYEQFMPIDLSIEAFNGGNVREDGLLCISLENDTRCEATSIYPYQHITKHFTLPAYPAPGEVNVKGSLNGFGTEAQVSILPLGSLSANGTLTVERQCDTTLIISGRFMNTGSISGTVQIIADDAIQESYVLAGESTPFRFTTNLSCDTSVPIRAVLYGKEIEYLSAPQEMQGNILSGMLVRNIRRSGTMITLGILFGLFAFGILFKKFIYKSVN